MPRVHRDRLFADPDRLVDLYQNASNRGGIDGNSYPAYLEMAAYTDVFASATAALVPRAVNYLEQGALRPAVAEHTAATYLSVLGLRPSLGRWFTAAEDAPGASVVAVLGYEAWVRKFRADPSAIITPSVVFASGLPDLALALPRRPARRLAS